MRCGLSRRHIIWLYRLLDSSRSRANRNRGDLLIEGPGLPMIASPIVVIPPYHRIQGYREHNARIIRVIDTFANKKENDSDLIKRKAATKIDEDASPISCRRPSQPTHKWPSARSRRPGNTAVAPLELHISNTTYSKQSHTMPTHFILSIHLGPCLDQHPACGLVASRGSPVERGPLVLWRRRGEGGFLEGGERWGKW